MNQEALLSLGVSWLIRALALTLRIECRDHAGYFDPARHRPCLCATWHNRILLLPRLFERLRGKQRLVVLTSGSRDGGLLAAVVRRFHLEAVRGSSSRGGTTALLALQSLLAEGADVFITPDGPRGPRYELSPGLLFLAQKTGLPLLRVGVAYSRFWELKSWDRFRIPKPFSRVTVTLFPFQNLPPIESDADLAEARARFAAELREANDITTTTTL